MRYILFCGAFCVFQATQAQTVVFTEDFQQGIPANWTIIVNDTNTVADNVSEFAPGWIALPDPENPTDTIVGATSYFQEAATADRWLITPAITLGSYGNILSWNGRSHDPSYPDGYYVLVSTTDTQIASFTDTLHIQSVENAEWTAREANLSDDGINDQTVYIAFVLRSYDKFKLYIDDVSVRKEDPVGITEETTVSFNCYPNPASTSIILTGEGISGVRILQTNGQVLLDKTYAPGEQLSLESLTPGTYLVEVTTAKGIGRTRLIKR